MEKVSAGCPFGHSALRMVEPIDAGLLIKAYRRVHGIDVSADLADAADLAYWQCNTCGLGLFLPPRPASTRVYVELSRAPWYYMAEKEEYRLAARRVASSSDVLEVGCGKGAFASYLRDVRYVGLETNAEAVAAGRAAGLDLRRDTVEDFSTRHGGQFDVVCAFQVLEHIVDPAAFLRACVACLRPGGLLMMGVPNAGAFMGLQPDELLNMPPHHLSWWQGDVFRALAPGLGLDVVAIEEERLASVHHGNYVKTVAVRAVMRRLGIEKMFLFEGRRYVAVMKVVDMVRRFMLVAFGNGDPRLMPPGHSLVAILRKQ